MTDRAKLFGADSQYNALANAFVIASEAENFKDEDYKIYDFVEKTPKTSMVVLLVDALNEYGYKIVKLK